MKKSRILKAVKNLEDAKAFILTRRYFREQPEISNKLDDIIMQLRIQEARDRTIQRETDMAENNKLRYKHDSKQLDSF
jgi:hypothetical protein